VQFAALGSKAVAQREWQRLLAAVPGLLAGRTPIVTTFVLPDGRTFYRLRTNGFAGRTEALNFCDEAKVAGVTCQVP